VAGRETRFDFFCFLITIVGAPTLQATHNCKRLYGFAEPHRVENCSAGVELKCALECKNNTILRSKE
jgi:hypothetical protein